jgi:hypothetical protein
VPETATYELVVQHIGAEFPLLDVMVSTRTYTHTNCNAFVIDANLANWQWHVTARSGGNGVIVDSGPRSFRFAPCRLADRTRPCSAPE